MKVYEQKKKNLLIFVNNIYAAINMSCYLQNKEFGKKTVVIERITSESVASFTTIKLPKTNKKVELIKKIFLGSGVDKILIYNRPAKYHSFDIKSFLNFFLYIKKKKYANKK